MLAAPLRSVRTKRAALSPLLKPAHKMIIEVSKAKATVATPLTATDAAPFLVEPPVVLGEGDAEPECEAAGDDCAEVGLPEGDEAPPLGALGIEVGGEARGAVEVPLISASTDWLKVPLMLFNLWGVGQHT